MTGPAALLAAAKEQLTNGCAEKQEEAYRPRHHPLHLLTLGDGQENANDCGSNQYQANALKPVHERHGRISLSTGCSNHRCGCGHTSTGDVLHPRSQDNGGALRKRERPSPEYAREPLQTRTGGVSRTELPVGGCHSTPREGGICSGTALQTPLDGRKGHPGPRPHPQTAEKALQWIQNRFSRVGRPYDPRARRFALWGRFLRAERPGRAVQGSGAANGKPIPGGRPIFGPRARRSFVVLSSRIISTPV